MLACPSRHLLLLLLLSAKVAASSAAASLICSCLPWQEGGRRDFSWVWHGREICSFWMTAGGEAWKARARDTCTHLNRFHTARFHKGFGPSSLPSLRTVFQILKFECGNPFEFLPSTNSVDRILTFKLYMIAPYRDFVLRVSTGPSVWVDRVDTTTNYRSSSKDQIQRHVGPNSVERG